MSEAPLLERLTALRQTVRRRLALFGVCVVVAGGILVFLAAGILDWLLWLPPLMRLVLAAGGVLGWLAAVRHWVLRPLREPLSLTQLAVKLEQYAWPMEDGVPGRFEDRLSSTVEFLLGDPAGSAEMRRRVIENTHRMVRGVRFRAVLAARPLAIALGVLAGTVVLLSLLLQFSPGFVPTAAQRYVHPFGGIEWPRRVEILPLSTDMMVASGESATLRMRLLRGAEPGLRGTVHLRSAEGETSVLTMRRERDGTYTCEVSAITEDLTCRFRAGDDHTADRPFIIRVVQRPTVLEALGAVDPPAYAPQASRVVFDLAAGGITAVRGSTLSVTVRSSSPVGRGAAGRADAELVLTDGPTVPLRFVDPRQPGRDHLTTEFVLAADCVFRVRLRDEQGFENRGGRVYRVRVEPDRPPAVTLVEPRALTEVTPSGSVSLLVRADDDFGITSLRIVGRELSTEVPLEFSLTGQMSVTPAGERVLALAEHRWDVTPLALQPGAVLVYQAEATDNCTYQGADPQIGRSTQARLRIISRAEFDSRLRDELALLQDGMRALRLEQDAVRDETEALGRSLDRQEDAAGGAAESMLDLSAREARLGRRLGDLARRFERLGRRVELNASADPAEQATLEERIARLAEGLAQVASGPVSLATRELGRAGEETGDRRRATLAQAVARQQEATDALGRLIRSMDQWGDFQEVVSKTRDLLDRQQGLRAETVELGGRTLGRRPEDLPEQDQAALRQAQRKQAQLADEAEGLLNRMRHLAQRNRVKDAPGATALDEGVRAAVAGEVTARMRTAAEAVSQNRTAAAVVEQRTAETALARMLASLEERQRRELAELAKRMERFEEVLADLLGRQRDLRAATEEVGQVGAADEVLVELAPRQHTLRRNALRVADDMADLAGAGRLAGGAGPARLVRKSGGPMDQAETALAERDGRTAARNQAQAADLLAQAVEQLRELARKAAEEAFRRSMAALQARLEEVREQQQEINTQSRQLVDQRSRRGRLTRRENRLATRLAHRQDEVRGAVSEVRGELGEAAVYTWVIDRVLELVTRSAEGLGARRLDEGLAATQQRIVEELDLLVDALAEVRSLPPADEYASGGGGSGGGAAGQGQAGGVPDLAELLVLKAMQLQVNARTVRLAGELDADAPTEDQLRELRRLGERQMKIRELTEAVTRKARDRSAAGG